MKKCILIILTCSYTISIFTYFADHELTVEVSDDNVMMCKIIIRGPNQFSCDHGDFVVEAP